MEDNSGELVMYENTDRHGELSSCSLITSYLGVEMFGNKFAQCQPEVVGRISLQVCRVYIVPCCSNNNFVSICFSLQTRVLTPL